jgi:ABC-2 type transport system permease protein
VLYVTGEYSTGMIHSTLIAVPRRMPVLWAKLTVFLTITLSTMVTMSIAAFLAGEAVISHFRAGYSLSDPHALRVVIGTGVYLTLLGLLGLAIGWIVRSTPGALVSYLAVILVVPEILANIAGNPGKHIAEYFPAQAGAALINIIPDGLSTTPWTGITVMAAWTVVFLLTAALTLRLRDA